MLLQYGATARLIFDHEKNYEEMKKWLRQHIGEFFCAEVNSPGGGKHILAVLDTNMDKMFCEKFDYEYTDHDDLVGKRAVIKYQAKQRRKSTGEKI